MCFQADSSSQLTLQVNELKLQLKQTQQQLGQYKFSSSAFKQNNQILPLPNIPGVTEI